MAISASRNVDDNAGQERHEYDTPFFPVSFFRYDYGKYHVGWHWHEEIELICVTEGRLLVSIGQEEFELSEGEGYFCNSGILHKAEPVSGLCLQRAVLFHPTVIGGKNSVYYRKYAEPLISDSSLPFIRLGKGCLWHGQILEKMNAAWEAGSDEPAGFELKVRALLGEILLSVIQNRASGQAARRPAVLLRKEERVKRMIVFIEQNYRRPLTSAEIAGSADISPSESLRCFHDILHTTPVQFLAQYRMEKAREYLEQTALPVSEIAELCGYLDVSYFSRAFRHVCGMKPTEYRAGLP